MPALAAEAPGRLERSPPCAPGRGLLSRLGSSSKSVCEELHLARTSGPWPRVLERRSSQGSFPQESVCPSRCSTSGTGGVSIPQVLKRRLRLRVLEHFRLVFPSTSLKSRGFRSPCSQVYRSYSKMRWSGGLPKHFRVSTLGQTPCRSCQHLQLSLKCS